MRICLALVVAAVCVGSISGQSASTASLKAGDLHAGVVGDWVGVLEYRDYKEPVTSMKRVSLPTWLHVEANGQSETWHYVYDDGPGKVVDETEGITLNGDGTTLSISDNGKSAQIYRIENYTALSAGKSSLQLTTLATDAGKPAELRMTMTTRSNTLSILQEARPAASSEPFAFRHQYRFVRKEAPAVTEKR